MVPDENWSMFIYKQHAIEQVTEPEPVRTEGILREIGEIEFIVVPSLAERH